MHGLRGLRSILGTLLWLPVLNLLPGTRARGLTRLRLLLAVLQILLGLSSLRTGIHRVPTAVVVLAPVAARVLAVNVSVVAGVDPIVGPGHSAIGASGHNTLLSR